MNTELIMPQLPQNWVRERLDCVAEIVLGQSPPSSTYNDSGEGLPFYQGKLEFGKIFPTPKQWCSEPKKIAEKGDVLISVRAPVGPTNINPEKSCIGRGLAAVRGLGGIETLFMLYSLRANENVLVGKGTGTTFSAISGEQLRSLEISIPPLKEQYRLVSKIEELFSFLDAGIESLRKVQAQLKRYRQAVLKYAFEGKHSANWVVCRLESCSNVITKGESPNWQGFDYVDDGIFFIRSENVLWGSVKLDNIVKVPQEFHIKLKRSQLNADDVLVNLVGASIGRCGIVPSFVETANINQAVALIRVNDFLLPEFLMHFLLSPRMQKEIHQNKVETARPNISLQNLRDLKIPLPSIDEQKKVVGLINETFAKLDTTVDYVKMGLQQSERLRQAILKEAFEGQLVPQDPKDEPAERLLERIKAESLRNKTKNNNQLELSQYVK